MGFPNINPTLAVWMKSENMSDTDLAAAAGLSVDTIRRAKSGGKISRDAALKICKALGIAQTDIVGLNY